MRSLHGLDRRTIRSLAPALLLAGLALGGAIGCGLSGGSESGTSKVQSNAGMDWRDEVIYQVITDRFADGDVNNNWDVDPTALGRYQGGDWDGLIRKAGYLKELGVTTVWISPVVRNVEVDANVSGYHGYWTQDFLATNPHFGDLATLRRAVDTLHGHGIKVICDIVTNHVGQLFYYDIVPNGRPDQNVSGTGSTSPIYALSEYDPDWDPRGIQKQVGHQTQGAADIIWINQPEIFRVAPQPAMFQNPLWYHRMGRVVPEPNGNWPRDQTLLGDFPGGLKDLATERQDVRDALVQVFGEWIRRVDFDGFRIDTIKHVEHSFWTDFCPRIRQIADAKGKKNFFMFGEAFDGDDGLLASYTAHDMLDSTFYFSQKYTAIDGVIKNNAPTSQIEQLWQRKSLYGQSPQPLGVGLTPTQAMVNFIDNHDVPRFLAGQPDDRRLRIALGFIAAAEGVPCIYYGTEQGFAGSGDPTNRERLWDSGYATHGSLFQFTKRLLAIRKDSAAMRRGETRMRWATARTGMEEDAGIFAFERSYLGETLLYVMNVNPQKASSTSFGAGRMQTSFAQGTVLVDRLDAAFSVTVGAGGTVAVAVPSLSQRILTPQ